MSELREAEPERARLLRMRGVPALGAHRDRRGDHAGDGAGRRGRGLAAGARGACGVRPRRAGAAAGARRAASSAPCRHRRRRGPPGAAAPQPEPVPEEPEAPRLASMTLRLPDESPVQDEVLALGVDAGGRERIVAQIRNTSGIVDNYTLSVRGLPDSWWTMYPDTVYLVPFGAGGTYEQDVEIHLHPPRTAEAEARVWDLELVAESKAAGTEAATTPFLLGIQPFEDIGTKVEPERASGRRKVRYGVRVENKANAPALIAFEGADPDGDCDFAFVPPHVEVEPGETLETTMTVRPPKQMWIGRPHERRLEVLTSSDPEALAAAAEAATLAEEEEGLDAAG